MVINLVNIHVQHAFVLWHQKLLFICEMLIDLLLYYYIIGTAILLLGKSKFDINAAAVK